MTEDRFVERGKVMAVMSAATSAKVVEKTLELLAKGDRVNFIPLFDESGNGTVLKVDRKAVTIRWDDGMIATYRSDGDTTVLELLMRI
jgi:preprotein translocase subunit YajC